jgi:hypothetical protein
MLKWCCTNGASLRFEAISPNDEGLGHFAVVEGKPCRLGTAHTYFNQPVRNAMARTG